ncbi:MAG: hypothetical protein R3B06_00875 [Kofleriaceae bacterium]
MDAVTRAALAERWAYRATLEVAAGIRFQRLAERLEVHRAAPALVELAVAATTQERHHVMLCAEAAARFGHVGAVVTTTTVEEIAPATLAPRDRLVYEVVASCCITETANAAVVLAGAADVADGAIRRTVRTILADEVQHSQLGWRFLATHPLDDAQRAWLGGYLPHMLRGTVRDELFAPAPIIGDELTMQAFGTLPLAGRRQAFLDTMRAVVFPGLAAVGVDTSRGAAYLDRLVARAS